MGIETATELLARVWVTPEEVSLFTEGPRRHRDDWLFLMYEAPLSRHLNTRRTNTEMLSRGAGGLLRDFRASSELGQFSRDLENAYLRFVPPEFLQYFSPEIAN